LDFALVFLVVIPEGNLLFAVFAFAFAFVLLVVIPEGNLLFAVFAFALVLLVVIPEGNLLFLNPSQTQVPHPPRVYVFVDRVKCRCHTADLSPTRSASADLGQKRWHSDESPATRPESF